MSSTLSTHPKMAAAIAFIGTCAAFLLTAAFSCGIVALSADISTVRDMPNIAGGRGPLLLRLEHVAVLIAVFSFDDRFVWYVPSSPSLSAAASRALRTVLLLAVTLQVLLAITWVTSAELGLTWLAALGLQLAVMVVVLGIETTLSRFQRKASRGGTPVVMLGEARALFQHHRDPKVAWCGQRVGSADVGPHFCLLGPPRSGKTLLMRMLMGSAITTPGKGKGRTLVRRAVVYDPKREMHQVLVGQGVAADDVLTLNPFDHRALYWALAEDFDTPALAKQLAHLLIPDNHRVPDPFWLHASQVILEELISVLQQTAAGRWNLNDVVELMTGNPAHLVHALYRSERGRAAVVRYFGATKQAASVLASIDAAMRPYSSAAAAMARTSQGFSIREWLQSGRANVVVLGTDPGNSEALEPLNRVFLVRLGQLLLDSDVEDPPEEDHVWWFVDELPQLGRVPNLPQVAREARSKGCRIVIAAQSVEALHVAFGADEASDLIGLCSNIAFTGPNTPGTRELASRLLGTARTGEDNQARTEETLLTSEFNQFQPPTPTLGVPVLARVHGSPFWRGLVPPRFVRNHLHEKDETVSVYERRSPEWSAPLPLTELDYTERLHLPWPPPNSMAAFALPSNKDLEEEEQQQPRRESTARGHFNPL